MSEKKYGMILTIILVIIIVGIIALLGFLIYNQLKTKNETTQASDFVDSFIDSSGTTQVENTIPSGQNTIIEDQNQISDTITDENTNSSNTNNTTNSNTSTTKKKAMYKGFETIGTIEIPKTNLKYPILSKLSVKSLDTAVVAVYPRDAVLNTVGNVVIQGHNYRNGTFFSNNKKLNIGDKIYITDLDGKRVTYVIYNKFETSENDTKPYNKDTNGKREITLSTCLDAANDQRLIIEAREE